MEELPDGEITVYVNGDYADLCRGPHVEHTGKINSFKLTTIAGAYWRGDEKRPMLQRIYGLCFNTKDELNAYVKQQEEAAKRLGKSRSAITNAMRLLNLPENVLELLKSGFINIGHAKVILSLPTPELQEQAAQIIADNQLNVRQAEALCKKLAKPAKEPREPQPRGTLPVEVEESLKQVLGSEVNVAYHGGKGKLTVHFYSDEQLRAFANLLGQYQMETE